MVSMPTTINSFLSCPPEIHGLILSSCSPNDQTCLRLTCKYLYALVAPTTKGPIPLTTVDPINLCNSLAEPGAPWNFWEHRRRCHDLCLAEATRQAMLRGHPVPRPRQKCVTHRWRSHCECFDAQTKLYQRIRTWIPRGLRYCSTCERFTRRKPRHEGRCYHGKAKPRKQRDNIWTYRSRRGGWGYGRRMWKWGFTNGAMNRMEGRLSRGSRAPSILGTSRYELRPLPEKVVNTRKMRYESRY